MERANCAEPIDATSQGFAKEFDGRGKFALASVASQAVWQSQIQASAAARKVHRRFICFDAKLVIELDGGQHAEQAIEDTARDAWLERQGFQVLRFWNNELMTNSEGVLAQILKKLSPSPQPSPIKGEGVNRSTE